MIVQVRPFKVMLMFCCACFFLQLFSCEKTPQQESDFTHCLYSEPEAIFRNGLKGIQYHDFQLKNGIGIEELGFFDDIRLTIRQSGCDEIVQEFRFEGFPYALSNNKWQADAISLLKRLGRLGPEYLVYHTISEQLLENEDQLALKQPIQLEEAFYFSAYLETTPATSLILVFRSNEQHDR
ncbi:MAG TPA: hypothetical protein PKA00_00750 [Saprospiraceae bacterium]|nr:hypothetical protein [Saprospiraceae bacterium]HMQ81394.1 hypothetical protein [Saprospiraceae bacterium]